ncbi:hypothetical protein J4G43_026980 [Bradyrhizobium barranii subsp. barranii]|uniref:Uncharacterized protein n=1 Tax=Bradyrhizobium barranii subsp. barranii TaxID=2823807 RepID=A0A939MCE7_9BRAD|nr:hypothetical protein [Bradyrhizobium barranii]UEM08438.1 hypothetical protein J4G43_026980 [Bradyrhizobium barranii subsp. barranii]
MTKVVVDNSAPEARQRQLEAQVQVAFAKAASKVLAFLVGKAEGNMIMAMQEFIAVHEAAEQESIDPKGIAIRVPKLGRTGNDENEHINMILRGSLNTVAAMLKMNAKIPTKNRGGQAVDQDRKARLQQGAGGNWKGD